MLKVFGSCGCSCTLNSCTVVLFDNYLNSPNVNIFTMKKLSFYTGIACFSFLLALNAQAKQTFTITQGKPEIKRVDIGPTGMSVGDLFGFEAPFTTKDGKIGRIYGIVTIVSIPTGTSDPFIDRLSSSVLDFGNSDTVVVSGKTVYGTYQGEIKDNEPQLRAIIGGTGRFIGARGQISTTRTPSGSYEHEVQLLD